METNQIIQPFTEVEANQTMQTNTHMISCEIELPWVKELADLIGVKHSEYDLLMDEKTFNLLKGWKHSEWKNLAKKTGYNVVQLEMVMIPSGSFMMGSPETEEGSNDDERPQHHVTVPSFLMGKYPVTQAQYQAIMGTNPSLFKGSNRPVECVSWDNAVAFCEKLSQITGKTYRLPSEAEWEYACRAGTTTPFHFGETITTDLVNYNCNYTYGQGSKGVYRKETTEVGSFGVANNFGLYDMHGNVWEWCQDDWHNDYEGAPIDGSAWLNNEEDNNWKLLRGGSWDTYPENCRSAFRNLSNLDHYYDIHIGFRVVCERITEDMAD